MPHELIERIGRTHQQPTRFRTCAAHREALRLRLDDNQRVILGIYTLQHPALFVTAGRTRLSAAFAPPTTRWNAQQNVVRGRRGGRPAARGRLRRRGGVRQPAGRRRRGKPQHPRSRERAARAWPSQRSVGTSGTWEHTPGPTVGMRQKGRQGDFVWRGRDRATSGGCPFLSLSSLLPTTRRSDYANRAAKPIHGR